jgi:hypothetical protein
MKLSLDPQGRPIPSPVEKVPETVPEPEERGIGSTIADGIFGMIKGAAIGFAISSYTIAPIVIAADMFGSTLGGHPGQSLWSLGIVLSPSVLGAIDGLLRGLAPCVNRRDQTPHPSE